MEGRIDADWIMKALKSKSFLVDLLELSNKKKKKYLVIQIYHYSLELNKIKLD